jgi:hypothetical protein
MTEVIKSIWAFIMDKDRKLSTKAVWVTIILFLFFALDFTLGFTVQYSNEKKLDQIIKINTILRDKTLDSNLVGILFEQRKELINKKHPYQSLTTFIKSISFSPSKADTINNKATNIKVNSIAVPGRSEFWFIASSGGYYIVIGLLFILFFPFTKNENSIGQRIATAIIMALAMLMFAWFFYWLCGLIPLLFNRWWINYWLYFIIQNVVIFMSVRLTKYYKK